MAGVVLFAPQRLQRTYPAPEMTGCCGSGSLNFSATEAIRLLTQSKGLSVNVLLQNGQLHSLLVSQCVVIQFRQKLWPQGIATGSVNTQ
jgi:hypothetical protein